MEKKNDFKNPLLSTIDGPHNLKKLSPEQLGQLAQEIREEIVKVVSKRGGHLAANLGVVELTLALHYVFNSPEDKIIWDVGHQSYTHKLVTGRRELFHTLRSMGGLGGFPRREESKHDCFNTGHASTSISSALGIACARDHLSQSFKVIAVIGDGAMTGGMAFEALNQAGHMGKDIIVVLNDNEMSISHNVGAFSAYLNRIITASTYHRLRGDIDYLVRRIPAIGTKLHKVAMRVEKSVKTLLKPGMLFEELGFKYVGPIDGHDLPKLIETLSNISRLRMPILLHVLTQKGKGYPPAQANPAHYHSIGPFSLNGEVEVNCSQPEEGKPILPTYTQVFKESLVELAHKEPKVVAITAAMPEGTGLNLFAQHYPERFYDVCIAEQHAVTFAAGLASQGMRPIVAIYSTFLQRAFDQILHDVCLQGLPIIFAIDRAGIVGEDGPTHHGLFDISYLRPMPGMTLLSPKDENELKHMLMWAFHLHRPVAIRYPKAKGWGVPLNAPCEPIELGVGEVLSEGTDLSIFALGSMVYPALQAAELLRKEGIEARVVNMRFAKPINARWLYDLSLNASKILTVEEHILQGGFGSHITEILVRGGLMSHLRVECMGIADEIVEHGSRESLLKKFELSPLGIYERAKKVFQFKSLVKSKPTLANPYLPSSP